MRMSVCGLTALSALAVLLVAAGCRKKAPATATAPVPAYDPGYIPPTPPKPPNPANESQFPHDAAVEHAGLRVQITSLVVGRFRLQGRFAPSGLSDECFAIGLDITNLVTTDTMVYHTWAGGFESVFDDDAHLKDDKASDYHHAFNQDARPAGGVHRSKAIAPGETITDVLTFMKPRPDAKEFYLDLPAGKYGGKGKIRFRIPATAVEGFPSPK